MKGRAGTMAGLAARRLFLAVKRRRASPRWLTRPGPRDQHRGLSLESADVRPASDTSTSEQRAAQDQERYAEVDDEPRDVDEPRHERRRRTRPIEPAALEHERDHPAAERAQPPPP